ncbi:MAG: glutamate--cysteine ligase, partial [Burkholderiaceae bacterium]
KTGRKPGLMLKKPDGEIGLTQWGIDLLDRISPYADILDTAYASHDHSDSVKAQRIKIQDSKQTPSARLLQQLREQRLNFHDYSLKQSQQHRDHLLATPLSAARQNALEDIVAQSFTEQTRLEQSDTEDFSAYVARYEAALAPF